MASNPNGVHHSMEGINPGRLFVASCIALISASVTFAVIGAIVGPLKSEFYLTNTQVGYIGGAALWGFTVSIFIFGPLCDVLGLRALIKIAWVCHVVGVGIMVTSGGFWQLFWGALVIAMGNGLIEAACNPLVATLYPDRKTEKLNQFHVWFPGGIVIGGLLCYLLGQSFCTGIIEGMGLSRWQVEVGLILIPTIIYGILILGQKFPDTERAQAGVSYGAMVMECVSRPLFILLFVCFMITASIELGPNRWLPSVYESGNLPGLLVLVWISGLMAVLRFYAGHAVERLAPTGILFASAVLSGVGLFMLSYAEGFAFTFIAATIFAVGVCYFWPTMLGVASERVPKGGAIALALLGGIGNVVVGFVAIPLMGLVADDYAHSELPAETAQVITAMPRQFPALKEGVDAGTVADIDKLLMEAAPVAEEAAKGVLPDRKTENLLRAAMVFAAEPKEGDSEAKIAALATATQAKTIISRADNVGGRMSFRWLAPFSLVLMVVFGALYMRDLRMGGYKAEVLGRNN